MPTIGRMEERTMNATQAILMFWILTVCAVGAGIGICLIGAHARQFGNVMIVLGWTIRAEFCRMRQIAVRKFLIGS